MEIKAMISNQRILGNRQPLGLFVRAFICLLPVACCLILISCSRDKPKISGTRIEESRLPVQEFFDTTRLTLTEDNRKLWTLTSTHIIKYRKDSRTYVNPVDLVYFQTNGTSHLTADSGKISENMDTLIAMGKVKISTAEGKRVTTSLIAWDKKSAKVTSDKFVRMVTEEGDVYSGRGFIANTDLSEWRILRNVQAEIHNVDRKFNEK
ncbi:MAG: LPS export ABC transporter periplasmic protein LptC [Candidatus Raymondbacteria bacterium RifOxyC12_full_50_8]|uniref:LPS export ABC transporter periplasmic protein LptC n=1 Tax=Candidatus Raymondbacteria bacterium RIFOXYD12_FULL_49_13 TaxID=1817890 RepID=A0A1F7F6U3_UNCRA|nr:MAG: LPS export ABC transporter periplasmic protein LptC [Candidatus Raymondbacteria bacterium RIFOXYA2_FULL_49_16]OGJ95723.1 MAG: LPS export ABC transporter periplasmic protein LptC [Candidatus Raymondbacteria bacterium RifOxyC12_full_50_8]OGJ96038.1 MAG: LPS export ABC transporter periplasmic protein LptC [Candidatus Raymondbacteria bacterium RifOxyB12_full_50_8]OGK02226.1 MAG: LPS export ABC transporter periplasmic protein LptC [Candidatus Raymondbacteria bacterium RIFOXYD12_FULL_49_13]OG